MPHVFLSRVKPFFITYTNLDAIATKTRGGGEMLQMPLVTQEVVEWVTCVQTTIEPKMTSEKHTSMNFTETSASVSN